MSMYFVGIDISKYKHDCCIISAADQQVISKFTIKNNKDGFSELLAALHSLSSSEDIRIGFESTGHYALNLELFLEKAHHSFMEVNPVLISEYKKSTTLRRTKTDRVDCESIARWLMTVEYKPHSKGFYHAYSLKSPPYSQAGLSLPSPLRNLRADFLLQILQKSRPYPRMHLPKRHEYLQRIPASLL